jgi:hypothetical protein
MSWPGARKVLAPVGAAVTLGVTDGAAVIADTGVLGDATSAGDPADVGDPTGVLAELAAVELDD